MISYSIRCVETGDCLHRHEAAAPFFFLKGVTERKSKRWNSFFRWGVISSTHGIRGEVKVFPTTDDPSRFKKLKKVLLDEGKERLELEVQSVKFFKQFVIREVKGIDNMK